MLYRKRGFQVVALPSLQGFDRTECASAAERSDYSRHDNAYRDLASLEGLAAELFMTRVALEKERRAHDELQRAYERLSQEVGVSDESSSAPAPSRRAAFPAGGS